MIGVDDVAELRSLLRRRDIAARQVALGMLANWRSDSFDSTGARALLEAASGRYPSVTHDTSHPAETLARMLWTRPCLVAVSDVVRVFVISGERARRAFLQLLALRCDDEGLRGLEILFGPDGPTDLLPSPTTPLLAPVLDHHDVDRLVPMLCAVAPRRGWSRHAAELLHELQRRGRLDDEHRRAVIHVMRPLVDTAVDACDRTSSPRRLPGTDLDMTRSDREQLEHLARLFVALSDPEALVPLHRMLGSADPRVSVIGAVGLVQREARVGSDRFALLARDPATLAALFDGLDAIGATGLIPPRYLEPELLAQADLVRWLSGVTELGRAPDEIEPITSRHVRVEGADDGLGGTSGVYDAEVHLFRFRMRAPHWSHARGWMVGTAGEWTYSCYAAEDQQSLEAHIESVRLGIGEWPDQPR